TEVIGRGPRSGDLVPGEADERRDLVPLQELEVGIEHAPVAVVGVLAGNDALSHARIGERRQRAEGVGLPVSEGEAIEVALAEVKAERAGGTDAEVAGVEAEVIGETAELIRGIGERSQQQAASLVDLGAVHVLAAAEIEPA